MQDPHVLRLVKQVIALASCSRPQSRETIFLVSCWVVANCRLYLSLKIINKYDLHDI